MKVVVFGQFAHEDRVRQALSGLEYSFHRLPVVEKSEELARDNVKIFDTAQLSPSSSVVASLMSAQGFHREPPRVIRRVVDTGRLRTCRIVREVDGELVVQLRSEPIFKTVEYVDDTKQVYTYML